MRKAIIAALAMLIGVSIAYPVLAQHRGTAEELVVCRNALTQYEVGWNNQLNELNTAWTLLNAADDQNERLQSISEWCFIGFFVLIAGLCVYCTFLKRRIRKLLGEKENATGDEAAPKTISFREVVGSA